ncbi:MAG: DUF2442 domain-containing protein [Bacteroidota bacterium]
MSTSVDIQTVLAKNLRFETERFYVLLEDGREIGIPYEWFPLLDGANEEELKNWRFIGGGIGIHWESLDEDISVIGLLKGQHRSDQK